MRATAIAATIPASSIGKQFYRVLLFAALFVTASVSSWAQNITVSPGSLTFSKQLIDTTSASKSVTITITARRPRPSVL